ncbi:MAG: DUF2958 domain-containing protein, partial [Terriglobia bacterium]
MILIPDELRPQLLANGRDPEHDHFPVVKLFDPCGAATWLISAIEPDDEDILFGLCDLGLGFPELGSVRLSELESIRRPFDLRIERDLYFEGKYPLLVYAEAAMQAEAITTSSALLAEAAECVRRRRDMP